MIDTAPLKLEPYSMTGFPSHAVNSIKSNPETQSLNNGQIWLKIDVQRTTHLSLSRFVAKAD